MRLVYASDLHGAVDQYESLANLIRDRNGGD